ncbi:hypothetical protein BDW42DRAFT_168316 [Aspergillus taichungensis]|uniref:Uncharacterized protein n=1 Tax=Aspergillus taichungensis TaxID=482145 RepID=A0A2J5HW41_9EURO|nr:hypothetical protein BDW42DRAFT_168316 [Aspergillus taichungensis]
MSDGPPRLFSEPPICDGCDSEMSPRQTRSNANGNRNRWFYECQGGCRGMIFDDWEGIRDGNPQCGCGMLSRVQKEQGSAYVFRCARRVCDFDRKMMG